MKQFGIALILTLLCAGTVLADETKATTADNSTFSLPSHFAGDLVATFAFGLLGIVIIVAGYKIFDWACPTDFAKEIEKGNVAAAMTVAAVILGLCYVVATVISSVIS